MADAEDVVQLDDVEMGWEVRLCLVGQTICEGKIFTVDPVTNTIVLMSPPSEAPPPGQGECCDLRLVPPHAVEKIVVINREADPALAITADTPKVDPKELARREQIAFQEMEKAMAELNPNAPPGGQAHFDALNKTMDCTWNENSINVLDQVRIDPPYDVDCCHSLDGNQASLDRIKKVLTGIKKKFAKQQQRRDRSKQPVAPFAPSSSPGVSRPPGIAAPPGVAVRPPPGVAAPPGIAVSPPPGVAAPPAPPGIVSPSPPGIVVPQPAAAPAPAPAPAPS